MVFLSGLVGWLEGSLGGGSAAEEKDDDDKTSLE